MMSPLADAIYKVLIQHATPEKPLITYKQLVNSLPALESPYDNLAQNDDRLFKALGEVGLACREHELPLVTALVIRSAEKTPGLGYFQMFHPGIGGDKEKQNEVWELELKRVKSTKYPRKLGQGSTPDEDPGSGERQRSGSLGHLRIADNSLKPNVVFTGQFKCPECSGQMNIEVERNANAVSPKQPAFIVFKAAESKPIGHLFIGTILQSPVLYYGALNHCGTEHRVAVFFNRGLRDRTDSHLVLTASTSNHAHSQTGEPDEFRLTN